MIEKRADDRTVAAIKGDSSIYSYDDHNAWIVQKSPTCYWAWIDDGGVEVLWQQEGFLSLEAAEVALAGQVLLQRGS